MEKKNNTYTDFVSSLKPAYKKALVDTRAFVKINLYGSIYLEIVYTDKLNIDEKIYDDLVGVLGAWIAKRYRYKKLAGVYFIEEKEKEHEDFIQQGLEAGLILVKGI